MFWNESTRQLSYPKHYYVKFCELQINYATDKMFELVVVIFEPELTKK